MVAELKTDTSFDQLLFEDNRGMGLKQLLLNANSKEKLNELIEKADLFKFIQKRRLSFWELENS